MKVQNLALNHQIPEGLIQHNTEHLVAQLSVPIKWQVIILGTYFPYLNDVVFTINETRQVND